MSEYHDIDPTRADVDASIVIPVWNKVQVTRKCIDALFQRGAQARFEVIVVDNASTDETAAYLASLAREHAEIRIRTNAENQGFVDGCNGGAELARGRYIVFLNNDTEPGPGWLDALISRADRDPKVGAVGAKLVYPDGKLQEAGGIIFSDGTGNNFGRGNDPNDPRYQFVREVDYCSGACLLVRADLFRRLGGFDRRYAPAYYEDTDLCFAVRDAGFKVLYEPACVVVHHEGTTAGTDTSSGFKRYQEINRPKFVARWSHALARQLPPYRELVHRASNRAPGQRLLVVDMNMPMHDRASGSKRLHEILKILVAQGHAITFIAVNGLGGDIYAPALREMGIQTYAGDPERYLALTGKPGEGTSFDLARIITDSRFDKAILAFFFVAEAYIPELRKRSPDTRILLDTVDVHFVRKLREAELLGGRGDQAGALDVRRRELAVCRAVDAVITVTGDDRRALLQYLDDVVVHVVPNVHDVEQQQTSGFGEREGLLFVGNFLHQPNVDAMNYFCREVLPLVRRQRSDITLTIAGTSPPPEIQALACDHITVTGYVPSLDPLLRAHRISVAPLRYGAGMKGKIGEALAAGLPVVTTSIGAEGMTGADGEATLLEANESSAMAGAIVQLYADESTWSSLARAGKEFVASRYGSGVVDTELRAILSSNQYSARRDPETTIVITTRNCASDIQKCLTSVSQYTVSRYRVVVVDDGSTDGTVEFLQQWARAHRNVELVLCKRGRGFSAACNLGLSLADSEYLVVLDSSCIVTDGWLSSMLALCEAEARVGMVGPMTNSTAGPQGIADCDYSDVAGLLATAQALAASYRGQTEKVDRLHGFCLLIRREVLRRIGGIDARLGSTGLEFVDLCLRAERGGYQLRVARGVFVHQNVQLVPEADGPRPFERDLNLLREKWGVAPDSPGGLQIPKKLPKRATAIVPLPDLKSTHEPDPETRTWEESGRLGVAVIVGDSSSDALWAPLAQHIGAAVALRISALAFSAAQQNAVDSRRADGWSVWASRDVDLVVRLNAALRAMGDEPVVLIGSDVVVGPEWLTHLTSVLADDPRIAVAAPVSDLAPAPQRPKEDEPSNERTRDAPYLGTFCLLFSRAACREVGPLRADVPLHLSLWDYFQRIRAHGHRMVAVPSVRVDHAPLAETGGASFADFAREEAGLDEMLLAAGSESDPARALDIYRAAATRFPASARSHQALGLAHLAALDTAKAVLALRAAVDRSPADPKLRNQLGYALAESGDTFAAERSFRAAVELVPRQLDGLLNLVELYRRRRAFDAASAYMTRLTEVAPSHPDVLVARAVLALETGDNQAASTTLATLRQVSPEHPALPALASASTCAA